MNIETLPHGNTPPTWLNFILLGTAAAFNFLQRGAADLGYEWTFRFLSLVSLLIVIYINFNKAKNIFKNRKKKTWKN
ncbi:MAG: hypothetical protein H0X41_01805 [Chitinophagaceae bacterium]|nr:hypothetical protein [Chitinophagaceae bacterium]